MATLSPPPLATMLSQKDGMVSPTWARWIEQLRKEASSGSAVIIPTTPVPTTQTSALYFGTGVPSNANGNNGDYYFRTDTPLVVNQRIYVKSGGAWVGIV